MKVAFFSAIADFMAIFFEYLLRLIRQERSQFLIGVLYLPCFMIIFNFFVIKFLIKSIYGLAIGYSIVMFICFGIYYWVFIRKEEHFWNNLTYYLKQFSITLEMSRTGLLAN